MFVPMPGLVLERPSSTTPKRGSRHLIPQTIMWRVFMDAPELVVPVAARAARVAAGSALAGLAGGAAAGAARPARAGFYLGGGFSRAGGGDDGYGQCLCAFVCGPSSRSRTSFWRFSGRVICPMGAAE